MALSEAEREQARRIAIELKGTGGRCMFWHHTPEGYEFWVDVFSKLVAIADGAPETDPSEYADALKLLWSDRIAHASYHNPASGCKRFEDHFTEAENEFRHTEDGEYMADLVDVILPWEVD